ncbi:MAG: fibronectin type III domain-containing protein [Pseudomonadota bacterium]
MLIRQKQDLSGRRYARTITIAGALILAGCQEDSRASKTSIDQAASIAGERLNRAVGGFRSTLGQNEPAQPRVPALTWHAPLTREDGSPLKPGQIHGYRIYFRLKHRSQLTMIRVDDPGQNRFSLGNLPPGAYEFSITAVDGAGLESRRSAPVSVNLAQSRQG